MPSEACRDRLSFRYVTGNLVPDHDTIASFRKRFGPLLEEIFLISSKSKGRPGRRTAASP